DDSVTSWPRRLSEGLLRTEDTADRYAVSRSSTCRASPATSDDPAGALRALTAPAARVVACWARRTAIRACDGFVPRMSPSSCDSCLFAPRTGPKAFATCWRYTVSADGPS